MKKGNVEKVLTKTKMGEEKTDFAYWQTKSYAERLAALEEIRREYNNWKYTDAEQRFQRVYRIVKLKQMLSKDFREFIESLNSNKVKYLVDGGCAVAFH